MKRARIPLLILLGLTCSTTVERTTITEASFSSQPMAAISLQGDVLQFVMVPEKGKFVVQEGDSFVVAILGSCPPASVDTSRFELSPPTPSFVRLLYPFRGIATSQALILVAPERGDAGKHTAVVSAVNCEGKSATFTFTIKVKSQ